MSEHYETARYALLSTLPLRSKYYPRALFSYALDLCPSHRLRDKVSYQYKTMDKIVVLCLFIFLDRRWKSR